MANVDFSAYLDFLNEFSSLYDFKMSEFVLRKVWESIPSEWAAYLVDFPYDNLDELFVGSSKHVPETLKRFIQCCNKLNVLGSSPDLSAAKNCLKNEEKKRFKSKKIHEIEYLAPFIVKTCNEYECVGIVDVGCGAGYLSEILSSKIEFVIGLDCIAVHCDKASYRSSTRQISNIKFLSMTVEDSDSCRQKIYDLVSCQSSNEKNLKKFAFVGLHCCGDLQPIILKLFETMDDAVLCFTISCCYHKMIFNDPIAELPNSFPMSSSMKRLIDQKRFFLSKFALRAASQETKSRWIKKSKEEWDLHEKSTFFRGVVECLAQDGINVTKTKRRIARPNDFKNFCTYVSVLMNRVKFSNDFGFYDTEIRHKLNCYYENNAENMKYVKVLTLLQALIQGVLESFILLDRMEFIRETGNICDLLTIFDDTISPRNSLLLAKKRFN